MRRLADRPGLFAWVATVVGTGALIGSTVSGPGSGLVWESPTALFGLVVATAGLCVVASIAVIVVGMRDDTAEIGILGGALLALSMLGLAHGVAVPGVLFGRNGAVAATALLALPVTIAVASPLVNTRKAWSRAVARRWRLWVVGWTVAVAVAATVLLARPAIAAPAPRSPATLTVASISLVMVLALSLRQLRLYWVGEVRASLVGSLGIAFIGVTAIQWIGERPFSLGFWLVHLIDTVGVLAACTAVALGHRADRRVSDVLGPILERDPLASLELGLAPIVRRFVAALAEKDEQTRDHVVRVAETATLIGERIRIAPRRLRYLGLAAILHDIGKLSVDDAILKKPGRLTSAEYERMKRHTVDGEQLLLTTPVLAPAAPFVRSHHERVDGGGYPDGLVGDEIPLEARIIAACDAYDAIATTRHYRAGLGNSRAASILQEHAGSQWDADVVVAVLAVVEDADEIGRMSSHFDRNGTGDCCTTCRDALPPDVRELLSALSD